MPASRNSIVVPAAGVTTRDLIGGLVIAVGLGALADTLPLPLVPRRGVDAVVALSITLLAGRTWGRDMARLAATPDPQRTGRLTAWTIGPAILAAGALLALAEPGVVARATRAGYSIHFVYSMLFVPVTGIVAAVGAFALGMGLEGRRLGIRLATNAGVAALLTFLVVDLVMYAIGWRVGAPNAARRATMLVVTLLGAAAAAVAAGAAIGAALQRRFVPSRLAARVSPAILFVAWVAYPSRGHAQRPLDLPDPRCGESVDYHVCDRRNEARVIARDGGRVRRVGDTLALTFGQQTVRWVDGPRIGEGMRLYFYVGTLVAADDRRYAVIRRDGYEANEFILADWARGDTTLVLPGAPLLSPDRRRVVGSTVGEDVEFTLDVWRLGVAVPIREFTTRWPDDMPIDLRWIGGAELRFRLKRRPLGEPTDGNPPVPVRLRLMRGTTWTMDTLSARTRP